MTGLTYEMPSLLKKKTRTALRLILVFFRLYMTRSEGFEPPADVVPETYYEIQFVFTYESLTYTYFR